MGQVRIRQSNAPASFRLRAASPRELLSSRFRPVQV